jgi:hypothetical protein
MSQQFRLDAIAEWAPCLEGPSEPASHTEHRAALEATVFRSGAGPRELVLELDAGELRIRRFD